MMARLAARTPPPPPDEQGTPQQQGVGAIRNISAQSAQQDQMPQDDRTALLQEISRMAQQLSKPRKFVRDKNNRVIGIV